MIKKRYQKPTIEVTEADVEQQILAGSLTSVNSIGLDDENDLLYDDEGGDQGIAW